MKSCTSTGSEKLLPKMLVETASLALMAVAISGEKSFLSTVAKSANLRKIQQAKVEQFKQCGLMN